MRVSRSSVTVACSESARANVFRERTWRLGSSPDRQLDGPSGVLDGGCDGLVRPATEVPGERLDRRVVVQLPSLLGLVLEAERGFERAIGGLGPVAITVARGFVTGALRERPECSGVDRPTRLAGARGALVAAARRRPTVARHAAPMRPPSCALRT